MESRDKVIMCRLCLCENEYFINIFEMNDWEGYFAAELISDLLQCQVSRSDGYPHVVCSTCLTKLTDFKMFKEFCQKSKETYERMFISRDSLVKHRPEIVELIVVKEEPVHCSNNGDHFSKANDEFVIPDDDNSHEKGPIEKIDDHDIIDGDEVKVEPFEEINHLDVSDGDEFKQEPVEEIVNDVCGSKFCEQDPLREASSDVQHAAVDTVTNSHHLQCFGHKRTLCTSKGEFDADSYKRKISTESSSGTTERMEGQFISPEKGIYMAPLIQEKIGIHMEVKKEELCGEGGRETAPKKGLDGEKKQFECYHCGSVLKSKRTLINHMTLHGFGHTYNCDICGKAFQSKYGLTRHAFIHAGSKPYKCTECSKCFSENGNLKVHMRLHLGSKPYKCALCLKCFTQNSSLKSHMRSHTDSKPYKCTDCDKCFKYSSNLMEHMRIHTGSKPFKCDTCFKGFTASGALKRHLLVHTKEKPYECFYCSARFGRRGYLNTHLERHCEVGIE